MCLGALPMCSRLESIYCTCCCSYTSTEKHVFFSSSSVIVHFLLAMHFYHQIINFLKCWKKCLFLTTSSCLIIRLHSPRSMCTTRVSKTRCVFTRCWEETMGGHSTSLIKRNHVLILWTEMDYINVAVIVRILYLTDK